ncbi:MAG: hypothetical protein H6811_11755 [Phycisphaeraceae bacterium]|nr:hypothetical protein [Phycisphaeraceae bacterium]
MRSRSRAILALAALGLGTGLFVAVAGPVDPPGGPVQPSFKTLTEIEPRTPLQSLPGSTQAIHVISQPGSYYLTGPVVGQSGKHGIQITADDVTLDLNGFTLQGVSGSLDGVSTGNLVVPINNLAIRNGVVRNWGRRGISADQANNAVIDSIRAFANGDTGIRAGFGISPPTGPIVRNCVSQANALDGIHAENGVVESCVSMDNFGRGISALGSSVSNCTASTNDTDGIGGSGSVVNCVAVGNGIDGIHMSGTVADSRTSSNQGDGIEVTPGSVVRDCRSTFNAGHGVLADTSATIRGNAVRDNQMDGIRVNSGCLVQENVCESNVGSGIRTTQDNNRIQSNTLTLNGAGLRVDLGGNLIIQNSASDNATNFALFGANTAGPILSGGGTIVSTSPWANFEF